MVHICYFTVLKQPPRRSWWWRFWNPPELPTLACKCGKEL